MRIGTLADRTGTNVPTIRYYESIGLLPQAARQEGRQRVYGERDVERLTFIRRCREFGFSVEQVRSLEALGRDRSEITVTWQRRSCIAPTHDEAVADAAAWYAATSDLDLHALSDEERDFVLSGFLLGDPDEVGEQLSADLGLGVDGFTINAPVNGHVPGRVELLGEVASKVVGTR